MKLQRDWSRLANIEGKSDQVCRLTVRTTSAGFAMPHPPPLAAAPGPAPAATSLLCEPCMASCGALSLQGPNAYLAGQDISPQVSKCASPVLHNSKCLRTLPCSQDLRERA